MVQFYLLTDDEDYAIEVYKALEKLRDKYALIATYLGLSPNIIKRIRDNHPEDNAGALNGIIVLWVRQKHDIAKFGYPCWRKVVEAAIGAKNELLAKEIAKSHPGKYSFRNIIIINETSLTVKST